MAGAKAEARPAGAGIGVGATAELAASAGPGAAVRAVVAVGKAGRPGEPLGAAAGRGDAVAEGGCQTIFGAGEVVSGASVSRALSGDIAAAERAAGVDRTGCAGLVAGCGRARLARELREGGRPVAASDCGYDS